MESLINQTYNNLEIILVDDGSVDDSPQICDSYARNDSRIRVIHKENGGLGFARNSGLELAKGEYVAFCDSDDFVDRDMYRRLMEEAKKERADAVFCDFVYQKNYGTVELPGSTIPAGSYPGRELLRNMLGALPEEKRDIAFDVSVCKSVYCRKTMECAAAWFRSERDVICEDLFFHIDFLLQAKQVRYIPEKLYHYCTNEGSLSHRFLPGRLEQEKQMYRLVCQIAGELLGGNDILRWQRIFLGRVRSTIGQYVYYAKEESLFHRLKEIRRIANDELVRSVISQYPIWRNPIKLRIFNSFLKWKFCTGMYLLLVFKR